MTELEKVVKSFFEDYLDYYEISDEGRVNHPIVVSCSRALKIEPLGELLLEMRRLSSARPYK
jgi:hypothetical protein